MSNNEFWSRISICQFTECCISSHLCIEIKFPSPFNSQSTTSSSAVGKATNQLNSPWIWEYPWIALTVVVQKRCSTGFSTKARKSGNGTFGVSDAFPLCPVCHLSRVLHFVFLGPTATSAFAIVHIALFKSKKQTTRRFLKSRVWLRKPGVGRQCP